MASRTGKWLKGIALAILGILVALALFILLFNWNLAKGLVESKASSATGRTIKINGDLGVHFNWSFEPLVELNNISITNMATGSAPLMVEADKINFQFNLLSAFSPQLDFPLIELKNANILLEKDAEGHANWLLGAQDNNKQFMTPKIHQLLVRNSKLTYRDPAQGTDLTVTADSSGDFRQQLSNVQVQSSEDFIKVNGDGSYKKAPFNVEYNGASVLALENRHEPYPLKSSITIAKTTISFEGTVLDPIQLKGLDITLNVKGANAADLFPILGMALPPTPPYSLTGKLDYENKVWKFNNFKGKLGDSDLGGNLTWDTSKTRPLLTAKFVSQNLNFKDLGGFIGAAPKGQPASKLTEEQKAKLVHQETSQYVIPDAPLDISRLGAMDADVEFKGERVISPNLPLDDFYMHVVLDDLILKVDPVQFGTANGDISAKLTVNARVQPPVIDSYFQFKKLDLSRLFEKIPVGDKSYFQGFIGGTAKLQGTGKSLRDMLSTSNGDIGIGMDGGQLSNLIVKLIGLDIAKALGLILTGDQPIAVRCVIGDFAVDHGIMQSRHIVIDTANSNIQGAGTINLSNEKMDIVLKAHQKDRTILSLKSPITIGGTLKSPSVGISPENLIVRSGVAAAASVALTPFVAALAFVEPGLGKDSDCAKLINEMDQHTGSSKASSLVPENKNAPVAKTKQAKKSDADVKPAKTPVAPRLKSETPPMPGEYSPGH